MSPETVQFLLGLLDAQQIDCGAPDFEAAVASIILARRELTSLLTGAATS